MKLIALLSLMVVLSSCGGGGATLQQCPADISIVSQTAGFSPSNCYVNKNATLTFTNKDSTPSIQHNATFSSGASPLSTGNLSLNQISPALTFATTGEFSYFCSIHPGMTGKITVR